MVDNKGIVWVMGVYLGIYKFEVGCVFKVFFLLFRFVGGWGR